MSPAAPLPFRPLGSLVLRRTLAAAALVTLLAAALQSWHLVHDEHAAFDTALRDIAESNVPLLSMSVWDIEPGAVRRQLQSIASRPEIAYVLLEVRTGQRFEAGNPRARDPVNAQRLEVPSPEGRSGTLASIEISADHQALLQRVAWKLLEVVGPLALLSAVICLLVAVVLRRELEQPMRALAGFATELTPERLTTRLDLHRGPRERADEIDLVASAFGRLQDALHAHVANLDRQVAERTAELERALDEIRALTVVDPLTGCYNRRHLDDRLVEEVLRSQRSGRPLAVLLCDLDHFKSVNDQLGHAAGDEVLRGIARLFHGEMRAGIDWVARFGGEEFVVVLPDANREAALAIAGRLRQGVQDSIFTPGGMAIRITASFGLAECRESDDAASLLARADAALYRAKAEGRNRVAAP